MQTDDVARSTVDASAGRLLAIMADVDTVSGYLLAGIGDASATQGPNVFVVSNTTSRADMETAFRDLSSREDVAVLLVSEQVADVLRDEIDEYKKKMSERGPRRPGTKASNMPCTVLEMVPSTQPQ